MSQNISTAVMARRVEPLDSADDFPTPPWATRALIEHVLPMNVGKQSVLEPACGAGHMAKVLTEYFREVEASDAFNYGYAPTRDFLTHPHECDRYDWIITNPPFRLAEEFIQRGLKIAREGVAVLVRTVFIESVGRYNRLFKETPPTFLAQFAERVPMVKGRIDPEADSATGYAWLVWRKPLAPAAIVVWIPPCRKTLERDRDYDTPLPAIFGR